MFPRNNSGDRPESELVSGPRGKTRGKRILCYVTDRRSFPLHPSSSDHEFLLRIIEAAASAGVDWIQLREKDLSGKEYAALTREALQRVTKLSAGGGPVSSGARILVNDRLDVALAECAGGVHLGENSLPPVEAKCLLKTPTAKNVVSQGFLVGVSCHSLEAAESLAAAGADYLFFGPVFPTPAKVAFGAPQGLERLAEVCRSVSIPVVAIGGITLDNATSCFAAGAAGIAAIRLFQDTQGISSLIGKLRALS